jgi:hypothetical protein
MSGLMACAGFGAGFVTWAGERKVPPLRSLRIASVGMTESFQLKSFQLNAEAEGLEAES